MQTRNTSRRMLRSDTAPERQALDGNRNSVENQRIDRLERNLEEVRDDVRAIAGNMNTTIVNMNSNLSGEITDLKQMMAGLVQSVSNLVTGLAQVQTVAEAAQRASNEARQRAAHDDLLCQELNQCVHKNALVCCEFMEPNFQDKLRNKLLTIKQTGGYSGYVGKFRELNRIVQVDSMTAMNLFLNGLSDLSMKREILRKKPRDLNTAIQEGFLEWDLKAKPATTSNSAPDHRNQSQGKGKDATGGSQTKKPPGSATPAAHKTGIRNQISNRSGQTATKCPNCKRGYHKEEDCWFKYPEKRPKSQSDTRSLNKKIFALLERMVVSNDGNSQQDDDSQASN
ncbi:hypothetical protein BBJ28_00022686 [Nothophytophthora sp. Chile5]|nr:hypothetical protein BBJ28_00022686 [Nothophytophthora sp. Chile5]